MNINAFFANRLGATIRNHRWSWGAVNDSAKRVFLRTNEEHVFDDDGDWVLAYNPDWDTSHGHKERLHHIDMIKSGFEGYAVLVRFNDGGKIQSFDDQTLLRLGSFVEEEGLLYSKVVAEIDTDDVVNRNADGRMANELSSFWDISRGVTVRLSEVKTRLGQGDFRNAVLRLWDYRCCVTGISTSAAIRASHIKPWRKSTRAERLDPLNGLPLVATLDALFDVGLISFDNHGRILISTTISAADVTVLNLNGMKLRCKLPPKTQQYLEYHRRSLFVDE
jgi:putative restriction endonuclease